MAERPHADLIDLDEGDTIVVKGTPAALQGVIPLRNRGGSRAVLRELAIVDRDGALGGPSQATHRVATTVLRPQQARALPVALRLPRTTPPGDYELSLRVGEEERRLVAHVVESTSVQVEPNPLVVENRPGTPIRKSIIVTNTGNVPVSVGEIGAVVLDDELLACRSLRAVADVLGQSEGDEEVTPARFLTQLTREFRTTLDQAGKLRVRNVSGPVDIEPGAFAKLDLDVEVPDTLEPRTRFFGSVAIYTTDLQIVVVPHRAAAEPSELPPPARRRATRTTRPRRSNP
jgi:hypothetical protein